MYVLAGVAITKGAANWMLETFLVSYLQNSLHFDQTASFAAVTPCLALVMIVTPLMGLLGDKIGRKPLLITATAGFVILSWPVFILMSQKTLSAALIAILVLGLLTAIFCGAVNATMASLFPPRFRSGGIAAPYNIAASICGGGAPFIATWLVATTGYTPSPAFYLMAVAAITLATVVFALKDRSGREEIATVAV